MIHDYAAPERALSADFSMQVALENDIPTYSGGLGGLAGDVLRSAADLGLPTVGVTLRSRKGYFFRRPDRGAPSRRAPRPTTSARRRSRTRRCAVRRRRPA